MRLVSLAFLAALPATTLNAQTFSDRLSDYRGVLLEAQDCRVLHDEAQEVFGPEGFEDEGERRTLSIALIMQGQMMVEPDRIRLIDESCPIAGWSEPDDMARVPAFLAVVEANNCAVPTSPEALPILAAGGFQNPNEVAQVSSLLIADGSLVFDAEAAEMRAVSDTCPAE